MVLLHQRIIFKVAVGLIAIIACNSCSRTKSYLFEFTNSSDFRLDSIEVQMGSSADGENNLTVLTLLPGQKSQIIEKEYTIIPLNVFGAGSLMLGVSQYSDSTTTYYDRYGVAIDRNRLKTNTLYSIDIKFRMIENEEEIPKFQFTLKEL